MLRDSYALLEDKSLEVISASVSNGNAATCWLANTWYCDDETSEKEKSSETNIRNISTCRRFDYGRIHHIPGYIKKADENWPSVLD